MKFFCKSIYLCMDEYFACIFVCAPCVTLVPMEGGEDVGSLELELQMGELPCEYWESNLSPMEE